MKDVNVLLEIKKAYDSFIKLNSINANRLMLSPDFYKILQDDPLAKSHWHLCDNEDFFMGMLATKHHSTDRQFWLHFISIPVGYKE